MNQTRDEVQKNYSKEKIEVQRLAQTIWDTWQEINKIRQKNNYRSSNCDLKVYKNTIDGLTDYNFNIVPLQPSKKSEIPRDEANR